MGAEKEPAPRVDVELRTPRRSLGDARSSARSTRIYPAVRPASVVSLTRSGLLWRDLAIPTIPVRETDAAAALSGIKLNAWFC